MDVSEVKVLARRANGLLVIAPILMLICGFVTVYSLLVLTDKIEPDKKLLYVFYMFSVFSGRRRRLRSYYYYHNPEMLAFLCAFYYGLVSAFLLCLLVRRLFVPKTIIEYDDFGLYIYKKGMPVTLLRYEALWSVYAHEELFESYEDFDSCASVSVKNSLFGLSQTGAIRIETTDDFIVLSGIYHVKEVEKEIKRMVRKNRREFLDEMYENIEKNQIQRELEELAKHNPDT